MRDGVTLNMEREEVGMEDISSRLSHKKVCNISLKRNRNKLESALNVARPFRSMMEVKSYCMVLALLCTGCIFLSL